MVTTIRIGRLVVEAASRAEGEAMLAAFRGELERLAPASARAAAPSPSPSPSPSLSPPPHATGQARILGAATPAGRGREAARRILPQSSPRAPRP